MSLTYENFTRHITNYTEYAKDRIEQLEKDNERMRLQLESFAEQRGGSALYLDHCRYPDCDFWFINGMDSDFNYDNPSNVWTCSNCLTHCCVPCHEKHGWISRNENGGRYSRHEGLCEKCKK